MLMELNVKECIYSSIKEIRKRFFFFYLDITFWGAFKYILSV